MWPAGEGSAWQSSHELSRHSPRAFGCVTLRPEQSTAFEASMQMLGLQELPSTANSRERSIQVSHVCSVVSLQPTQSQ
jgi:hypothetical protein